MKIAKATITALLYTSKTLANGEHPVMIRVCYNGKRKYKSTGLSCPAKLWNTAKQEVRGRHPLSMNMNALIESELMCLKNKVLDYERQGMAYSVQSLLEASGRKPPSRKTLDDLFEERIAYFRDSMQKHNTAAGYQTLRHIIGRYSQNRTVELFDVDKAWLQDFEQHLHTRYADTSIKRFFSAFKALMNYAYMVPFLGPGKARGNDFVFPIYFDEDPVHQFERITYANNVINQSLQRVAKRIGLTRKVTFYAARHTYASRLYHADVPLPLIAQNMGRNPAEIETYLKEFDTDKIISANKRIWQIPRTEPLETNTGGL